MRRLVALLLSLLCASPSFAVIALRADGGYNEAFAASVTLTNPSGLTVGDCMLAFVSTRSDIVGQTIATPSGWTYVNDDPGGVSGNWLRPYLFAKVATSGDVSAGSLTFTATSAGATFNRTEGNIRAYSGTNASNCVNATALAPPSGNVANVVANAVSETFFSGEWYVVAAFDPPNSASTTYSPSLTDLLVTCNSGCSVHSGDTGYTIGDLIPSGAPAAETISGYTTAQGRVAIGVTILPAGGGPAAPPMLPMMGCCK